MLNYKYMKEYLKNHNDKFCQLSELQLLCASLTDALVITHQYKVYHFAQSEIKE